MLLPSTIREAQVFDRIRATQRPEENAASCFRGAFSSTRTPWCKFSSLWRRYSRTTCVGYSPEEARNRASLMAIQQAQAEREQALGEAQAFGGMFTQQAGLSSQLQSQAQQKLRSWRNLGCLQNKYKHSLKQKALDVSSSWRQLIYKRSKTVHVGNSSTRRATQLYNLGCLQNKLDRN